MSENEFKITVKVEPNEPKQICRHCGVERVKKFLKYHKSPTKSDSTKRRKKFVDESGRQHHGTKCPECASKNRKDKSVK